MKAYNTPKDELHIESDNGETLVSITPEKTTIANFEGGGGNQYLELILDDVPKTKEQYSINELKALAASSIIPVKYVFSDDESEFSYSCGEVVTIEYTAAHDGFDAHASFTISGGADIIGNYVPVIDSMDNFSPDTKYTWIMQGIG